MEAGNASMLIGYQAWARSSDKMTAESGKQILCHMDQLCAAGKTNMKADSYSYNTVLNA